MFRLLVIIIILFIVYRTFKVIMTLISSQNKNEIDNNIRNVKRQKKYDIKQSDIVDADFEEIKEDKKDEEKKQ